jgi:hypothetical protein
MKILHIIIIMQAILLFMNLYSHDNKTQQSKQALSHGYLISESIRSDKAYCYNNNPTNINDVIKIYVCGCPTIFNIITWISIHKLPHQYTIGMENIDKKENESIKEFISRTDVHTYDKMSCIEIDEEPTIVDKIIKSFTITNDIGYHEPFIATNEHVDFNEQYCSEIMIGYPTIAFLHKIYLNNCVEELIIIDFSLKQILTILTYIDLILTTNYNEFIIRLTGYNHNNCEFTTNNKINQKYHIVTIMNSIISDKTRKFNVNLCYKPFGMNILWGQGFLKDQEKYSGMRDKLNNLKINVIVGKLPNCYPELHKIWDRSRNSLIYLSNSINSDRRGSYYKDEYKMSGILKYMLKYGNLV